jgi:type I restriction enzyme R subunit
LFLADRNALVTQAKKAFNEHLPNLSAIDLTKNKETIDSETRLVFSTYPTIMNRIDSAKSGDARFYGVGNFDLIIIDEAHRSVYQKYGAIFDYFDAQLIGLTATPKKQIDFNTYELFDIEDDNPTFAYELNTAVDEKYLVPPKSLTVPLKFPREGIKYNELSDFEKQEYEEKFGDPTTTTAPDELPSAALNKWLFNTDTVDKVLDYLMNNGTKVAGGDKLGKTIIFAKNHAHAVFIEERFNVNYPEFGGHFLRVIDNYESTAIDLLEKFKDPHAEVNPQIAVSVDMMDTGVDAPRVVNLVFFKQVKSVTKFWQMIGRGTRLFPDLFGPGEDKKEFLILDFCENFEFFDEFPDGLTTNAPTPLLQQIFEARLDIAQLITQNTAATDSEKALRDMYLGYLHEAVASLDHERFVVKRSLRHVVTFTEKNRWLNITKLDELDIKKYLSNLESSLPQDDEKARRFDVLTLKLQLALLTNSASVKKMVSTIRSIAHVLQKKDNLPQVREQLVTIKAVQEDEFWDGCDVMAIENVRIALRELMKYLDKKDQPQVYTHFEDELDVNGIIIRETFSSYGNLKSYKDRVENYIRINRHHLSIDKLSKNIPITAGDLLTLEKILFTEEGAKSKEQFKEEYGEQPLGTFIRQIIGIDQEAARSAFSEFLQVGNLTADQLTFINAIITHLTKNGMIDKGMLFEPPFKDIHNQGIFGVFINEKVRQNLLSAIDKVNGNAVA